MAEPRPDEELEIRREHQAARERFEAPNLDLTTDAGMCWRRIGLLLKALDAERARWLFKADGLDWRRGYRVVNGEQVEVTEAVITKPQYDELRVRAEHAERERDEILAFCT